MCTEETNRIQNQPFKSYEFEHNYLRNEIESNKKLVFERALLIAGAALAVSILPKEAKGIELLGIPSLSALAFNIWFTVNRLKSNMRIIAYIQLFHEYEKNFKWIGWENSLRIFRIWQAHCNNENKSSDAKSSKTFLPYDNLSFYKPIFVLHIAMAFFISAFMSFRACAMGPYEILDYKLVPLFFVIVNSIGFFIFVIISIVSFRPKELLHGIEKNRHQWEEIFTAYKDNDECLKKHS